ncbi:hypothetical protein ES319_A01G120600v1 [Gossypium barbadense]|uniref:Uncharacterized protein n=2 Tax=Gossypium TaxID=3633 RepID=A0A5J5WWN3_GOSBA|nr:hypothetical protein ES319_A01G120600v1 [Gossypium barbadense]KAB2096634.1 hypothetical protein ES319_A01G120600v1 [Gossypium barbadense]TYH30889.1 hypothetical protein ES288_A01G130600v1 [Gossypium darwinii]
MIKRMMESSVGCVTTFRQASHDLDAFGKHLLLLLSDPPVSRFFWLSAGVAL